MPSRHESVFCIPLYDFTATFFYRILSQCGIVMFEEETVVVVVAVLVLVVIVAVVVINIVEFVLIAIC